MQSNQAIRQLMAIFIALSEFDGKKWQSDNSDL